MFARKRAFGLCFLRAAFSPVCAPGRISYVKSSICVRKWEFMLTSRVRQGLNISYKIFVCSEMIQFPVTLKYTGKEFGYRLLTNEKRLIEI